MSQPLNSYFAMEAGEFLAELQELLSGSGQPDPDKLVRLAVAVRGSARMAGADTIAGVAGRLEDAAEAVLKGNLTWSEELRGLALQTIEDLNILVRATQRWGPEEEKRVRDAIERWDNMGPVGETEEVAVPIESLFYEDPTLQLESVVPIESLLLTSDNPLLDALRLKDAIMDRIEAAPGIDAELKKLLAELFRLIEIAAPTSPR